MPYAPFPWQDLPSHDTPVSAANLKAAVTHAVDYVQTVLLAGMIDGPAGTVNAVTAGADATGATSATAAIQALLDAPGYGGIYLPPGRYKIGNPGLVVDTQRRFLLGTSGNVLLDATSMTSGAAVTFRGSANDPEEGTQPWRQTIRKSGGLWIKGPGRTSSVTGIKVDTPGNNQVDGQRQGASAHLQFEDLAIHDCAIGFEVGSNTYALSLHHFNIYDCFAGIANDFPAANAGEQLKFSQGSVFQCDYNVVASGAGTDMVFSQCSINYPVVQQVYANKGRVAITDCRMESNHAGRWFQLDDYTCQIDVVNTEMVVSGGVRTTPLATVPTAADLGGLTIDGGRFIFSSAPAIPVIFDGPGSVRVGRHPGYRRSAPTVWLPPLASSLNAIDGVMSATTVAQWSPTLGTFDPATSPPSLKLSAVATSSPFAHRTIPVKAGQILTTSLSYRTGGALATNVAKLDLYWVRGGVMDPTRAARVALEPTATRILTGLPPIQVPVGVDGARIQVGASNNWAAGSELWFDEVVVNVGAGGGQQGPQGPQGNPGPAAAYLGRAQKTSGSITGAAAALSGMTLAFTEPVGPYTLKCSHGLVQNTAAGITSILIKDAAGNVVTGGTWDTGGSGSGRTGELRAEIDLTGTGAAVSYTVWAGSTTTGTPDYANGGPMQFVAKASA